MKFKNYQILNSLDELREQPKNPYYVVHTSTADLYITPSCVIEQTKVVVFAMIYLFFLILKSPENRLIGL